MFFERDLLLGFCPVTVNSTKPAVAAYLIPKMGQMYQSRLNHSVSNLIKFRHFIAIKHTHPTETRTHSTSYLKTAGIDPQLRTPGRACIRWGWSGPDRNRSRAANSACGWSAVAGDSGTRPVCSAAAQQIGGCRPTCMNLQVCQILS